MLIDLDRATMLDVMTERQLLTASAQRLAPVLSQEAGAGFLSRVGLPHYEGLFVMVSPLVDDPEAFERGAVEPEDEPTVLEWQGRSLLLIGYTVLRDAGLYVDRATGEVFAAPGAEDEYELVNTDVSSLAMVLLTIQREIPEPFRGEYDTAACAAAVRATVDPLDPVPFGTSGSLWNEYFDSFLY